MVDPGAPVSLGEPTADAPDAALKPAVAAATESRIDVAAPAADEAAAAEGAETAIGSVVEADNGAPGTPIIFGLDELPKDIETMVMTGATQAIFACRMDEDVTQANPYKMVPLETIKEDLRNRAGVSDFAPFKEKMGKYDGTEVLVIYDRDFTFDACFWCCTTEAAKVAFLQRMQDREKAAQEAAMVEESAAVEAAAAKRVAGWTSLGSDLEIDEARASPTRPQVPLLLLLFPPPPPFLSSFIPPKHPHVFTPQADVHTLIMPDIYTPPHSHIHTIRHP